MKIPTAKRPLYKQGEQQTDQNGIYQLDHLDYGMYIAHAEKDGLESYRSIVVSKSGIQAEPIYLGILISGEVLDEDTDLPLSGTEVSLVSALGFEGKTATDPDGCWEILLPASSCQVSFSCSGYQKKGIKIAKSDLDGGTRHFQIYLKKAINYYEFIRDELLPDMGYANLAAASRTVTPDQSWSSALGWDIRKGLLGADIADLNKDGTDDLLVYFFDASAVSDIYSALYASLYTTSEENEIILVNTVLMDDFLSAISYDTIQAGLMEVGGSTYLYTETNSNAYFANGSELMYCWYCYDGSMLRPCWQAGKTDGGSTDIAYSLLTYSDDQHYTKQVLWADGLFRSSNPNAVPLTDGEIGLALEAGFSLIGLPAPSRILCENSGYSVYSQKEVFPSYWNADILKPSVQYLCSGSGTYSARNMQVSAADFTDLQRHIEELED